MSPLSTRTATLGSAGGIGRRRPDPTPWGWEVPTAGSAGLAVRRRAGLLAAQGVAGLVTGHGWLWPDSPHLFPALGGLVTGHVGAGLDAPDGLPSPALVVVAAVVLELALLVLTVWAARVVLDHRRPRAAVWGWPPAPTPRLPSARAGCAGSASSSAPTCTAPPCAHPTSSRPARRPSASRAQARRRRPRRRRPVRSPTRSLTRSMPAWRQRGSTGSASTDRRCHAADAASDASPSGPVHQAIVHTDIDGAQCRHQHASHRFSPAQVGWRLGSGAVPRSGELWVPFDRTAGVYRPAGLRQDPRPAHPGAAVAPRARRWSP